MNFRLVFRVTGKTLMVLSMTMLLPLLVCLIYRENPVPFLLAIAITGGVGLLLSLIRSDDHFFPREGFFAVALIWLLVGACGALPFYFCGQFASYIDCFFEAVSGFTTTGSSILTEVESLPHGILFWRSFMHFLGGMGVLVLTIALLPSLGRRTVHLMKAESPGPQVEKMVPSVRQTAKILYTIYLGMTLIQIVFMLAGGCPLMDSLMITFGSAGTGGFGIKNDSMASYSPYIQVVVTVSMILFGVNFSAYFYLIRGKFRKVLIEEVRWYLAVVAAAIALISWNIREMFPSLLTAVQQAAFQVGSIITTTGYSSCDFDQWPTFAKSILVALMFIGACAGSTGGGMKISRLVILLKSIRREIAQTLHPSVVTPVRVDGKPLDQETIRTTHVFMGAYIILFAASVLLVSLDGESFTTNFTAVAATFNNIGPGLAGVGPMMNFGHYSGFAKLVMTFDMLAGRLEIFPLLLLFAPETWKKF